MLVRIIIISLAITATVGTSVSYAMSYTREDISSIPLVGVKTVTLVAGGGFCRSVAGNILMRENIDVGGDKIANAIMVVRPVKLELFPKRMRNTRDLLGRLSGKSPPCMGPLSFNDVKNQMGQVPAVLVYEKRSDGSVLRVLRYILLDYCPGTGDRPCISYVPKPGLVSVEFTRGSKRSGLAQLRKGYGILPKLAESMSISEGQERALHSDPDSKRLPDNFFVRYEFAVEPGQEQPWAFILNRLPYIEDAARVPDTPVATVDPTREEDSAEVDKVNSLRPAPFQSAAIPGFNAQTRSLAFLREWFTKKGGLVRVINKDDYHLVVRVDHLKGEVIRQEGFWEYLNVTLFIIADQNQSRLYVMNDGFYAAGVGQRIPPDASFTNMGHQYYSDLSQYTETLATQIQDHLNGHP